jgi:hypothetical protein
MDDGGSFGLLIFGLVSLGSVVWSIYDIVTGYFPGGHKAIWIVLCLLIPVIGPVLYLGFGRRFRGPA